MSPLLSLGAALALALVHLFAVEIRFLGRVPRSRWLSIAGGIPVSFVFLQILPAVTREQQALAGATNALIAFLGSHLFLLVLAGVLTFYGVERAIRLAQRRSPTDTATPATAPGTFWLSLASTAGLSAIIGYLLIRGDWTAAGLALYVVAMATKFLVTDYGLHRDHQRAYDRQGRWLLAGVLLGGWLVGALTTVPEVGIAVLRAFLAGGVLLSVLKEELPAIHEGSFWEFTLGATLYAALLLAL